MCGQLLPQRSKYPITGRPIAAHSHPQTIPSPVSHRAYPFCDLKRSNNLRGYSAWGLGVGVPDNRSFVAGIAARYGTRLRRFLSMRLRNAADVPDLAQEVFLRLLRVDGYESIRSPEAYLFTIASHVIHQHAVRRSSEPVSVDIAEVFSELKTSASDDPSDQAAQAQRLDEFERMLGHLPTRVATALVLHRVAGYSVQEVGR